MIQASDQTERRLFAGWQDASTQTCLIAADGQEYSHARIAALGAEVAALAASAPALVFIDGRNTPAFIAAHVAALRAGLAVHVLDPARGADNARLEAAFRPLAVIATGGETPNVRLTGLPAATVHPDLALLLPTSGTTGSSKMARISARAIAANTASIIEYLGIGPADRAITTLKPFYSFGLSVLNTHLEAGGAIVLNDAGVETPEFLARAASSRVTNFAGVPHTFELLATRSETLEGLPSLRFLAQAGGRLAPALVRQFAELGARDGWDFFVMYGQTEASPRISYLPPRFAAEFPDSIGQAIPGGRLWIADDSGAPITEPDMEGELCYAGPNVMSGYAHDAQDLAVLEDLPVLVTGDLARRLSNGLFVITGRRSRFVKPFGLRVSLDAVEALLADAGITSATAAAAQGDGLAVLVAGKAPGYSPGDIRHLLGKRLRLPAALFDVRQVDAIPLLANEKIDRRAVERLVAMPGETTGGSPRELLTDVWHEFSAILHGRSSTAICVLDVFIEHFGDRVHQESDSFIELGGDSMAAVSFAIDLEAMLGKLPDDWPALSIAQLERLRGTGLG